VLPSAEEMGSEAQTVFLRRGAGVIIDRERRGEHSLSGWLTEPQVEPPSLSHSVKIAHLHCMSQRIKPSFGTSINHLKRKKGSLTFPLL